MSVRRRIDPLENVAVDTRLVFFLIVLNPSKGIWPVYSYTVIWWVGRPVS